MFEKRKIKKQFLEFKLDFRKLKVKTIKSRLKFFCLISLALLIVTDVLSYVVFRDEFRITEVYVWLFYTVVTALILYMNHRTNSLLKAKINSFLFSLSFVSGLTALLLIYPEYILQGITIFIFSIFLISFILPWDVIEIFFIGLINILGYTTSYLWVRLVSPRGIVFPLKEYLDGMTFLSIILFICLLIKKRDNDMERHNFMLLKLLERKNKQAMKELALARDVHMTLIPKSISTDKVDIAVTYKPVSTMGGDYATFHVAEDGNLFFLISDITGHGVSAALLVNRIYSEVEKMIMQKTFPGVMMKNLNSFVQEYFKQTNMYLSACSGVLDFKNKILFYSNYGHPPQVLHQQRNDNIRLLKSQTYLLGIDLGDKRGEIYQENINFDNGDRVILFTDGLIEVKGLDGKMFGIDGLKNFVKIHKGENVNIFNSRLLEEINRFRSGPFTDDLFILTINIK